MTCEFPSFFTMCKCAVGADGGGERACLGPTLELCSGQTHIVANVTVRQNFGSEANNCVACRTRAVTPDSPMAVT